MRTVATIILLTACIIFFSQCKSGVSEEKMTEGKKVYDTHCQGCHMDNGMGVPRMNPPLVNSPYVMGHTGSLIELVLKGSAFFGNADRGYNNEMASFQSLSDEEIAALVTYTRNTYAKTGDETNAEDVKKVRAGTK
jgi:mono/diheme cytochrome c family protein